MNNLVRLFNWELISDRKLERAITWAYIAVWLLAILASYMGFNHVAQAEYFRADPLWMEDYLRDLFERGVDVREWAMTGLGYFPAMFVYGLIRYVTGSIYVAYVGLGLVCIAIYAGWFYAILGLITRISRQHRAWFAMCCTAIMMLVAFLPRNEALFYDIQFFTFVNRGSTMANAAISILLTLLWLQNPIKGFAWFFPLFALSILASITDRVYEIFFMFPAFGAVVILSILGRVSWRSATWFGGMVLASDLIGQKIVHWIMPLQMVSYGKITVLEGWRPVLEFLASLFLQGWYYWIVLFSYLCLVGVSLFVLRREWKAPRQPALLGGNSVGYPETAKIFLLSLSVLALPVAILSMALINRPGTYNGSANILVLSFWPFLLVLSQPGLKLWLKGWFHLAVIATLGEGMTVLAVYFPAPLSELLRPAYPHSRMGECLDAHADELGDGAGIADYWLARPINLFSKKGIRVYQAQGPDLSLFQWNGSREVLRKRKYTFVITNTSSNLQPMREVDVVGSQGRPDVRFVCEGMPVLVYKHGMKGKLFLRDGKND